MTVHTKSCTGSREEGFLWKFKEEMEVVDLKKGSWRS